MYYIVRVDFASFLFGVEFNHNAGHLLSIDNIIKKNDTAYIMITGGREFITHVNPLDHIVPHNQHIFMKYYEDRLRESYNTNPDAYRWDISELPSIVNKMDKALADSSFIITDTVKKTCKLCRIKPTYKAIRDFINS